MSLSDHSKACCRINHRAARYVPARAVALWSVDDCQVDWRYDVSCSKSRAAYDRTQARLASHTGAIGADLAP